MRALGLLGCLALAGCFDPNALGSAVGGGPHPGSELQNGSGGGACAGISVAANGGSAVLAPAGMVGSIESSPTGCKVEITDWRFAPPAATAQVAKPGS